MSGTSISKYISSVAALMKGNAAAHVVTLIMLPIISRLYSQEQFGYLALLLSLSGILATIIALRLELSVFNTSSRDELFHSFITAFVVSFILFLLLQCLSFLFLENIATLTGAPQTVILLVPFSAFLLLLFNLLTNVAVIDEKYRAIAKIKITRAAILGVGQVALQAFSKGLLLAEILARLIGGAQLFLAYVKAALKTLPSFSFVETLTKHQNFIKFSVVSGGFNSACLQLPSIFIAYQFGAAAAGLYLMTNRIIAIPLALFGQSMSQVFSSKLKKIENNREKSKFLNGIVVRSSLVSVVIFSIIALSTPIIVPIFLGEGWGDVSTYILYLIPMFFAQLAIFPINNVLNMLNEQRLTLAWDCSRFICLAVLCYFIVRYNFKIEYFLLAYSLIMLTFYSILLLLAKWKLSNEK